MQKVQYPDLEPRFMVSDQDPSCFLTSLLMNAGKNGFKVYLPIKVYLVLYIVLPFIFHFQINSQYQFVLS